ncbi:MAG: ABC transporter ATP-binding protein [Euryarchaeota archaeon]|nr:ABC transporter ATP-binding protein [Euryarchaeota archaeon]
MTTTDGNSKGVDNTAVEITELGVDFGSVTALADVSLSIDDGEFFTLVGPSGCGKTTLLRSIAGLETPSRGSVSLGGQDVTDEPPEERNVGIVFQDYSLFPHLSVAENVAYGLRFHELSDDRDTEARVTELLELVDLAGFGDREPGQLSGGQKQRVALARALAPEPDVLLLDEPLSALDARLRKELRVQIKTIQRDLEITTVYVTHDQAEALAISDRIAVMQNGRLQQVDTPETVYRQPASRAVAEFIGDNNVFEGNVADDGRHLDVGGTLVPLPEGGNRAAGQSRTVSIRPEALSVTDGQRADAPTLSARVETVEFLGDAYRVHCRWNDRPIVVKTAATTPPEGAVDLQFDAEDVHILEPQRSGSTRSNSVRQGGPSANQ